MWRHLRSGLPLLPLALFIPAPSPAGQQFPTPVIAANDNRTPAGTFKDGILNLRLELRQARWYAESLDGVYKDAYAFAEERHAPQIPGPLLRLPQGTRVHASIHNFLPLAAKIYGLHPHPGDPDAFVEVNAGETRDAQFDTGEPGTYLYWATTSNAHFDNAEERQGEETLLAGAFIVDPPAARPDDRIFVIVNWDKGASGEGFVLGINGKSWPETERLSYRDGEPVHWRIVNATGVAHAMHLHGFFFTVEGVGDPAQFVHYPESQHRKAVTEHLAAGHSFDMTWIPDRAGNWLFHCHMVNHMVPQLPLHPSNSKAAAETPEHDHSAAMGGMVIGITVVPNPARQPTPVAEKNARKLQLVISENPAKIPLYRLDLNDPAAPPQAGRREAAGFTGPADYSHTRRACRNRSEESVEQPNVYPLARHGTRELLRRSSRMVRIGPATCARHRARSGFPGALHPASRRHLHLSQPLAR